MENERNEEKKWEKIRIEKEIREDLAWLRTISSSFAANLISEEELQVMIQKRISKLCLVAVIVDLVQHQKEIIVITSKEDYQCIFYDEYEKEIIALNKEQLMWLDDDEDYAPKKLSQKELAERIRDTNKQSLVRMIIEVFKIRKKELRGEQNNTTIEAKQMSLLFFVYNFKKW